MTLDKLPIGKRAVITSVGGDVNFFIFFFYMGIIPKTVVSVRKTAPLGDPIEISLRGYTMTLRKDDASKIEVLPFEED